MKSPFQRRTALVALLLAPALAACGFGAQTDQVYQAAQGVNDRSGTVEILNAVIVASEDGAGTFAGSLVNQAGSAQTLTGISGEGVEGGPLTIAIGAKKLVNLGLPAKDGGPQVALSGDSIKLGSFVRLTLTFSDGTATVNVPVVSTDSEDGKEFANVPLASPSAS